MSDSNEPPMRTRVTTAERVFALTFGGVLCLGLALYWWGSWDIGRGGLGVGRFLGLTCVLMSTGNDVWLESCWDVFGVVLIALVVCGALFARRHYAWTPRAAARLAAGYAIFPLAATGALPLVLRLRLGHWPDMLG